MCLKTIHSVCYMKQYVEVVRRVTCTCMYAFGHKQFDGTLYTLNSADN